MMTIIEVNKEIMDFLKIPEGEHRNAISAIDVEIRPDAYPNIIVTQMMIVDDNHYTSTVNFKLVTE